MGYSSVYCKYVLLQLVNKRLWPMAGQNIARQESQTETGKKKAGSGKGKQMPEKQDMR